MAKIAVIIADMFEDSEYGEPVAAFKKAGHEIIHVGLKAGRTVKGIKKGTPVVVDKAVKDLAVGAFDALLIPGGYSPDQLRADDDAVRFVGEFVQSGKPVFVICHGPQLLVTARVLKGRKITSWKSVKQDVINAGAEFLDQEVVEDGNLISSRSPADLPAFIAACLRKL
jgi:protease I